MTHETLESRVLLAATFAAGKLTVTGTGANDTIALNLLNDRVAVFEGGVQTASFKGVKSIAVEAGGGNDRVTVDAKITAPARIAGGSGNDTLAGGSGPDALFGGNGNDQLSGGAGKDALFGGNDNDTLNGGLGDDYHDGEKGQNTISYRGRNEAISAFIVSFFGPLDGTRDFYMMSKGNGGAAGEKDEYRNVATLEGGNGNDTLVGAEADSYYEELRLVAPVGNISITDFDGYGSVFGGPGNDTFTGGGKHNYSWYGEAGNDTFVVRGSDDDVFFGIDGGEGTDLQVIDIGYGNTWAAGFLGDNVENADVREAAKQSIFTGNDLNNTIIVHDDYVSTVHAGAGNDRIVVSGSATVYGGAGNDTLEGGHNSSVDLRGEAGNDILKGGRYADILRGGIGDDALFGNGDKDALLGEDGNDYLEGGDGDDFLAGNAGNDTLRGGPGADRMEGNDGNDTFHSRDKLKDILYGGSGIDSAQRDASEQIIDSIENTLA